MCWFKFLKVNVFVCVIIICWVSSSFSVFRRRRAAFRKLMFVLILMLMVFLMCLLKIRVLVKRIRLLLLMIRVVWVRRILSVWFKTRRSIRLRTRSIRRRLKLRMLLRIMCIICVILWMILMLVVSWMWMIRRWLKMLLRLWLFGWTVIKSSKWMSLRISLRNWRVCVIWLLVRCIKMLVVFWVLIWVVFWVLKMLVVFFLVWRLRKSIKFFFRDFIFEYWNEMLFCVCGGVLVRFVSLGCN